MPRDGAGATHDRDRRLLTVRFNWHQPTVTIAVNAPEETAMTAIVTVGWCQLKRTVNSRRSRSWVAPAPSRGMRRETGMSHSLTFSDATGSSQL